MKNNDVFDELFNSDPVEHLVKILQNASPRAIQNTLERFLSEYAAMSMVLEKHSLESNLNEELFNITTQKQDLAIRLMSDVLSQGD